MTAAFFPFAPLSVLKPVADAVWIADGPEITMRRAGVRRMLAWDARRVILAHGRWYADNGAAELQRAFARTGA